MSFLTGTADNKEHYLRVWGAHVRDLLTVMVASGMDFDEAMRERERMMRIVERAADKEFPDVKTDK